MKNLLFSFAIYLAMIVEAGATVDVGWIDQIRGNPDHIVVQRGKTVISVSQFQILQEGDAISARKDAQIEIRLGEGKSSITVNAANSPYRVARVGEVPGSWSKMLGWLRNMALSSVGKGVATEERLQMAATRGAGQRGTLSVPLLKNNVATLLAGQRPLHLAWLGGQPPYSIRLVELSTGRQLMEAGGLYKSTIRLPGVDFAPGGYQLRIGDVTGASSLLTIEVVPEETIPSHAFTVGDASIGPGARDILTAAWLSTHDGGKWRLEAYQRLMASQSSEAVFLREALVRGQAVEMFSP